MRWVVAFALLAASISAAGCGYRLAGQRLNEGRGRTIAVPTFMNRSTSYRIEQRLTEAIRLELIRRTHYEVLPDSAADLVVAGEVLSVTAIPVIFDQQGRGSSYGVLVDVGVRVTDSRTGLILFQNDRLTFREVFQLAQSSAEFVPEDTAAMDRLARRFASFLVASLQQSTP